MSEESFVLVLPISQDFRERILRVHDASGCALLFAFITNCEDASTTICNVPGADVLLTKMPAGGGQGYGLCVPVTEDTRSMLGRAVEREERLAITLVFAEVLDFEHRKMAMTAEAPDIETLVVVSRSELPASQPAPVRH